jgi:hypothetical protein
LFRHGGSPYKKYEFPPRTRRVGVGLEPLASWV